MVNFRDISDGETHTGSPLPDFLRHDPKDRDNLDHDLDDNVPHCRSRSDLYICLKSFEEVFHAIKQIDKGVFAGSDVLDGLGSIWVSKTHTLGQERYSLGGGLQIQ